jgi:hypothetical protein
MLKAMVESVRPDPSLTRGQVVGNVFKIIHWIS